MTTNTKDAWDNLVQGILVASAINWGLHIFRFNMFSWIGHGVSWVCSEEGARRWVRTVVKWGLCAAVAVCGCYVIVDSQLNRHDKSSRAWFHLTDAGGDKSLFPYSLIPITTNMTSWSRNVSTVRIDDMVPPLYKVVYWIRNTASTSSVFFPQVWQQQLQQPVAAAVAALADPAHLPFEWTEHMRQHPEEYVLVYRLLSPSHTLSPQHVQALLPPFSDT